MFQVRQIYPAEICCVLEGSGGSNPASAVSANSRTCILTSSAPAATSTAISSSLATGFGIFDATSGYHESMINISANSVDRIVPVGNKIAAVSSEKGSISIYNPSSQRSLQIAETIKAPLKVGQSISLCTASRRCDSLLFFTMEGGSSGSVVSNTSTAGPQSSDGLYIQALLAPDDTHGGCKCLLSAPIYLDLSPVFKAINQNVPVSVQSSRISSMVCHPSKSLLSVCIESGSTGGRSAGCVVVWSYSLLRKRMLQRLGNKDARMPAAVGGAGEDNEDGTADDDETLPPGRDDAGSDAGSVASRSTTTSISGGVAGVRKFFKKSSKNKITAALIPRAVILAPKHIQQGVGSSICFSRSGELLAVAWNRSVIGIYDARLGAMSLSSTGLHSHSHGDSQRSQSTSKSSQQTSPSSNRPYGLQSMVSPGSLTLANIGQVSGKSSIAQLTPINTTALPGDTSVVALAFHESEPILIASKRHKSSSTNQSSADICSLLSLLDPELKSIADVDLARLFPADYHVHSLVNLPGCGRFAFYLEKSPSQSRGGIVPSPSMSNIAHYTSLLLVCSFGETFYAVGGIAAVLPIANSAAIPQQVFLDGDSRMINSVTLAVKTTSDVSSTTGTNSCPPLRQCHHIFQLQLHLQESNGSAKESAKTKSNDETNSNERGGGGEKFKHLGCLPSQLLIGGEALSAGSQATSSSMTSLSTATSAGTAMDDLLGIDNSLLSLDHLQSMLDGSNDENMPKHNWFDLPVEDKLPPGFRGSFVPQSINVNDLESPTSPWTAIVKGYSIPSHSPPSPVLPVICFVRSTAAQATSDAVVGMDYVFSRYRDAAFWTGASSSIRAVSSDYPSGALVLDAAGTSVKWIRLKESVDTSTNPLSIDSLNKGILASWSLPLPMSRLWTAPLGGVNIVVYLSTAVDNKRSLLLSGRGQPAINRNSFTSSPSNGRFTLMEEEHVMDLQWQPMSSSPSDVPQLWNNPATPTIGVLTNRRVLLLRIANTSSPFPSLELLNSHVHTSYIVTHRRRHPNQSSNAVFAHQSSSNANDLIVSIAWLCSSLCLVSESGAMSYLLPAATLSAVTGITSKSQLLSRARVLSAGVLDNRSFGFGRIGSISRTLSQGLAPVRILACLPDRVIIAAVTNDDNASDGTSTLSPPSISLHTRPWVPVEPLILGAIICFRQAEMVKHDQDNKSVNSAVKSLAHERATADWLSMTTVPASSAVSAQDQALALLCSLVAKYFHPHQRLSGAAVGANLEGHPAYPSSHVTPKLCMTLVEMATGNGSAEKQSSSTLGLSLLAACVVGVPGGGITLSDSTIIGCFPSFRWISPGFKFAVAIRAQQYEAACLALLSSRPELQERFLDPDSFSGGSLPHTDSEIARQCKSAARIMEAVGQLDCARKLADISGDDALLASLIARAGGGYELRNEKSETTLSGNLKSFYGTLEGRNNALRHRILSGSLMPSGSILAPPFVTRKVSIRNVYNSNRRTSMFTLENSGTLKSAAAVDLDLEGISAPHNRARLQSTDNSTVGQTLTLSALEAQQKGANNLRGGGGLGPPTSLGIMVMDQVEEWLGLCMSPEIISPQQLLQSQSQLGGGISGGNDLSALRKRLAGGQGGQGSLSAGNSLLPVTLSVKPTTWFDEIGAGNRSAGAKEHDKVVGYWRFSDCIARGEGKGFTNLGWPPSRLVFLDLSKYLQLGSGLNNLELFFADAASSPVVAIEVSTSNVDPGEDHEKVKSLNDVVILKSPQPLSTSLTDQSLGVANHHLSMTAGLRVLIGRGGPLDVGLYHNDPDRCRLTLEIMVRVNAASLASCANREMYLFRRVGGSPCAGMKPFGSGSDSGSHDEFLPISRSIYSLRLDLRGSLIWAFGAEQGKSTASPNELWSPDGALLYARSLSSNEGNDGSDDGDNEDQRNTGSLDVDAVTNEWVHVAVTVDSSKGLTGATTSVQMFINGARICKGFLSVPALDDSGANNNTSDGANELLEKQLAVSTLYVGCNLPADWRLTEVRVWSDVRTSGEIDEQRDNFLSLASKRKRQQLRIRGTKEIFTPLRDSFLIPSLDTNPSGGGEIPQELPDLSFKVEVTAGGDNASVSGRLSTAPARPAFLGPAAAGVLQPARPNIGTGVLKPATTTTTTVAADTIVDAVVGSIKDPQSAVTDNSLSKGSLLSAPSAANTGPISSAAAKRRAAMAATTAAAAAAAANDPSTGTGNLDPPATFTTTTTTP